MRIRPTAILKRILYILMSITIVINCGTSELTGVLVHIISGTTFCILFLTHIFLSRKCFIASCKNLFSKNLKMKMRINLIIDALMIILFSAIAITGILLANDILPKGFTERHDFELLHGLLAASAFMLLVTHICLHIKKRRRK